MTTQTILFVGNFLSSQSGHRQYCEDLADKLDQHGWRTIRTSSRPGRIERLFDMVRTTWLRRGDYEIAHIDVFSGLAFVWAEVVATELTRLGKPYVLTLHGGNLPQFARRWPARVRRLLASAATVTSPSSYLASQLAALAPSVDIVPNALDVSRYPYQHRERAAPRLVWVRAFHELYNPMLAVDALAVVLAKLPEATLTMVGSDKDGSLDRVRRHAVGLGIARSVRLVPGVPKHQVPDYLQDGDIFLNTTNVDNTPVSLLEAMACGLCVVTTNVGGIPYLVTNDEDALLVPPRDPILMGAAIVRLVEDRALASKVSRNAHRHATRCDWRPTLARWDRVFREAALRA
jgi:glycosyltransferase involved in cell wall biosynthesis